MSVSARAESSPRSDFWVAALLLAIGLMAAALAISALVSYHNGPAFLQLPGVARLQYDTAWVALLCGGSLMMYAGGLHIVARLCAIAAILISGLRVAGYLFPQAVSVHPLLANPWLAFATGEYNAMGVLVALIALVFGTALALLVPESHRTPWRSVALAVLTSIVLALSLLVAFGAWSGSTLAAQSLQLDGDERTSSLLFLLLGTAFLIYILAGSANERLALGRFAPAIVGLAVFVCVLVLWRAGLAQETRYVQHGTQLVAAAARGAIERDLRVRIDILERLAERMSIHSFNADVWQREGESILGDVSEYQSLAWSGPDFVIRWIAPPSNALGFNIRSDPKRRPAVDLAIKTRKSTLSRFTELIIGGNGIIVYAPLFQGDEYRGMVSGVLGRNNWLRSMLDGRFADNYFELLEDGEVVQSVAADSARASGDWTQELPVEVENARWLLRVTPTQEYVESSRSPLPQVGLALGAALSILLALATYFYQAARRRARDLNQANVRLRQDNARRHRAEQKLRESEQRTQLIISSVKDCAIYMLDPEGRIASWNKGAQTLNGYSAEEVLGQHFSVLYPPDRDVPPEDELIVATRRGWFEEECWHLRKDGTRYCADDIISAIRDEQAQMQGFAVVTRDATLRIEMREQTERARDHYFSLFSSFPNLVWRSDAEGACDYLNQAWLDYTGRPMDDQSSAGWLDSVHPDDRAAWRENIEQLFPTRQPFELEFRLRRADGTYGSMICSGRPYHDLQGQFAGYLCSCYDNTARRATEEALKESEERYQRITTNVPGMVFKMKRDEGAAPQFLYVSQGSLAVTGKDPDTIVANASSFFDLLSEPDRANLHATLNESAQHLTTWNWAGRLQPPHEAAEKWVVIRAKPRADENGTTVWDGVVFDDSQSRLAQLELERSREESRSLSRHLQTIREEEKARIAREVHDELGSTLTGLRIDLDWLIDHEATAPESARKKYAAMLTLVQNAVAATRKIVTDLRPSILDDLGLASAVRWQVGEYRKHSETVFNLQLPESDLDIDRDRALVLFRIFQETMTNVSRHANATRVDISLAQTDGGYVMQIRDNGIGIATLDMRKPTSHGIRGMRERTEQFGGSLSVSGEPGAGTSVVVTIPLPVSA
jgi:PAS domain S-box-containing protein